ncbi:MAG: methyl-accepting chemotaxis protein [Methylococcaceae bacterium]|nr:methyl-accepting chemotaxis protein [Methylococcaceae bacterium]
MNLKISRKIMLSTSLLMALIILTGGVALYGYNSMRASLQTVYVDRLVPVIDLAEIRNLMNANLREILLSIQHDPALPIAKVHESTHQISKHTDAVKANIGKIDEIWQTYMATYLTPEEKRLAADFETKRKTFVREGLLVAIGHLEAGDYEAVALHTVKNALPLFQTATEAQDKLIQLQKDVAQAEMANADAMNQQFIHLMIIVGVLTFLGLISVIWIGRRITLPLQELVEVVGRIAEGDLSVNVEAQSQDEVGQLSQSLHDMLERLNYVVQQVRANSDNLSSASQQVSATAQSMSQMATEQAAGVEETTSSIEELNASVQQNTENAHVTEQMAAKSAGEARDGGTAVNETVTAMKHIAKKIGQIEDIAYKTNLLSLNAAIEAASAGEHGKGFAVVAAEVRKLAESSRITAGEINELASNSVAIAEKAGNLIAAVVPNIVKTADLVQEINAASMEQSSGINQINDAMRQLDKATQQNAASAEQLAATAEELNGQAIQLQQAVAFFKLEGDSVKSRSGGSGATGGYRKPSLRPAVKPGLSKPSTKAVAGTSLDFKDSDFERF